VPLAGGQAEELGVEIFPGFAAAEVLFHDDGAVKGVATGDMGVARDGTHRPDYQPGMELHAKYTFFAEGARGSLTKAVKRIFDLEAIASRRFTASASRSFGTSPGEACGGPRDPHARLAADRGSGRGLPLSSGERAGRARLRRRPRLQNPHLYPFEEFQRWKQHPAIREILEGGRRVSCARDQRGRLAIGADAGFPRRCADRLLGGLRQRAAHQGQPHRDEEWHAGGR
jgi:electron-transferring-flavoprotein dehydrogenase